jgi:hypothetical protein
MRHLTYLALGLLFCGCGLETIFANGGHVELARPASRIVGTLQMRTQSPNDTVTVTVSDSSGNVLESVFGPLRDGGVVAVDGAGSAIDRSLPASLSADGKYALSLPTKSYSNLVVESSSGNAVLRALLPSLGEQATVTVDLDARSTTEALITQGRLSGDASTWKKVTPETYLATRAKIQAALDAPGPSRDLLGYVTRISAPVSAGGGWEPSQNGSLFFFLAPTLGPAPDYLVQANQSPLSIDWLRLSPFDYVGDGVGRVNSNDFDAKLSAAAKLFQPAGCPDPNNIRIMFTVNFNAGALDGNCGPSGRSSWVTDKPGKSMYFVGWIHEDSPIQNPLVAARIGNGLPNELPMHDDGQAGDEVAGDNIYTIYFDVPRGLRMGYKYTWGTLHQGWTGSEEWPGNGRIIEAVDVNGDDIVYRRDVFGDEATNKDKANLNRKGSGQITWDTVLRPGWGLETREQKVDTKQTCKADAPTTVWVTPQSVGPLTQKCQ